MEITRFQGGVSGLEELVRSNPDMTAVFVTNYEMTMGAMIGVNELGIKIPEQLSMIGFDNLQFARACNPKLTIVSQPTEELPEKWQESCWNISKRKRNRRAFQKNSDRNHENNR